LRNLEEKRDFFRAICYGAKKLEKKQKLQVHLPQDELSFIFNINK
jgi:hypothetical protein